MAFLLLEFYNLFLITLRITKLRGHKRENKNVDIVAGWGQSEEGKWGHW